MRFFGTIVLLFGLSLNMFSQTEIDGQQFYELALQNDIETSLSEVKKKRMPWIEEYVFRTETSEFDPERQEYTFRFKPSTLQKRKAQKAIQDLLFNSPDIDAVEYLNDRKIEIHEDWLKLYQLENRFDILKEERKILADKTLIFEKMAGAYDFNFQKLVNLRTDKSDLDTRAQKLENELGAILIKYQIPKGQLNFENFIDVAQVRLFLEQVQFEMDSATELEYQHEQALIQQELKLERAEKRQFLDFAQIRYNGPHDDPTNEKISVGIGFAIPNSGNNRLKIQELQLKEEEVALNYSRDQIASQSEYLSQKSNLNDLIEEYDFQKQTMEDERSELLSLSSKISQKQGYDPLILLNIEERHLENREELLKTKIEIFEEYLSLMELSDRFNKEELVNYLQK